MTQEMALVYVVATLVGVLLAIVWLCLPFAVFGVKPLLRELLQVQREQQRALDDIRRALGGQPPA